MRTILSLIFTTLSLSVFSQHLDVEGHSRIRGNLDINHMDDTTSIFIGRQAGVNTNFDFAKSNTFVGAFAGFTNTNGASNSFFGRNAGYSNFIGFNNSFFGESAGYLNNAGWDNSFFGMLAGYSNTDGNGNSFFGREAGRSNSTGNYNTAIGYKALYNNTVDDDGPGNQNVAIGAWSLENADSRGNTAVGTESLRGLTNGGDNTAVGEHALRSLDTGNSNTAVGYSAMINTNSDASSNVAFGDRAGENARGDQNSFVGASAGFGIKEGIGNVFVGYATEPSDTSAENQIVIGSGANGIRNNSAVIGNENITDIYMSEDSNALLHSGNIELNEISSNSSSDSILVISGNHLVGYRSGQDVFKKYQIGDLAFGGIVFWVDQDGKHGLVAGLSDIINGIQWGPQSNITGAIRDDIYAGMMNTERIIINQGTLSYAADLCASFHDGGYGDWYLPSKEELNLIYLNLHLNGLGNLNGEWYWSSTEGGDDVALVRNFMTGNHGGGIKTSLNSVRAIRKF